MAEAHDAPRRADAIRGCVFANDMEGAIRWMLNFAQQFAGAQHADEVVLLSRDLREVDEPQRREEVAALNARKERRKIAQNLLDLLRLLWTCSTSGITAVRCGASLTDRQGAPSMALPELSTPNAPRSTWRHWMWLGATHRRWLLNRPLLRRSGLLWLPGPVLLMTVAAAALAGFEPVDVLTLPAASLPTTLGFFFFLLMLAVYFYWVLVPRSRHALGVRGWRDHLQVLAITYLGTLLLVLPLCVCV